MKVDQYGDQEQFSFFIQEKLNNNHVITTNSSKPSVEKNNLQIAELRVQQVAAVRTCFFCPHCHMKFLRFNDKEMHSLVEHSYEQPFICQECGLRFKMKQELEQHMISMVEEDLRFNARCVTKCARLCPSISGITSFIQERRSLDAPIVEKAFQPPQICISTRWFMAQRNTRVKIVGRCFTENIT